jgi:hypothetical protein
MPPPIKPRTRHAHLNTNRHHHIYPSHPHRPSFPYLIYSVKFRLLTSPCAMVQICFSASYASSSRHSEVRICSSIHYQLANTACLVWVKRGICSADSLINVCLFVLGYIPGLLHAWYIIATYPDPGYERLDNTESQVHVIYVRGGPPPPSCGPGPGGHSTPQAGYGTLGGSGQGGGTPAPAPAAEQQSKQQSSSSSGQQQQQAAGSSAAAPTAPAPTTKQAGDEDVGPSEGPPPSYSEVVKGDNKIQSP